MHTQCGNCNIEQIYIYIDRERTCTDTPQKKAHAQLNASLVFLYESNKVTLKLLGILENMMDSLK